MSRIKLSATARGVIQRLYEFLAQFDLTVADNGSDAHRYRVAHIWLPESSIKKNGTTRKPSA